MSPYIIIFSPVMSLSHSFLDDYNRVLLKGEPDVEGSDYINASFINVSSYIFSYKNRALLRHAVFVFLTQGYPDKKKVYIASQGANLDLPVQCSSFFTTCLSS